MAEHRKAPLDRVLTLVRALADSVEGLTLDEMAEVLGQKRRSREPSFCLGRGFGH